MQITRKIELARQHIRSITHHDDAPVEVRAAALDRLAELMAAERTAMAERAAAKLAAEVEALKA